MSKLKVIVIVTIPWPNTSKLFEIQTESIIFIDTYTSTLFYDIKNISAYYVPIAKVGQCVKISVLFEKVILEN